MKKKVKRAVKKAVKAVVATLKAWSFSKYTDYAKCPRYFKAKHLDKLPEEKGAAMGRGIQIHEQAEFYVRGHSKKWPEDIHKKLKPKFDTLRKGYKKGQVKVEVELALTSEWKVTGWFYKDAWVRLKIDVLDCMGKKKWKVIDWKSGNLKNDHSGYDEQLEFYAMAIMIAFPEVEEVIAELGFTDHGVTLTRPAGCLTRKEMEAVHTKWKNKIRPMFADKRFAPRPGNHCRWCYQSRNRGGTCEF